MALLPHVSIDNQTHSLFSLSFFLSDRVHHTGTQINYNPTARKSCARNRLHVADLVKSEYAFKPFDETRQWMSFSTNNPDFTGYIEDSELGMTGTSNFQMTRNHNANKFGTIPDKLSLIRALSHCTHLGSLDLGRKYHTLVIKIGFDHDKFVATSLVGMYCKCGDIENACKMFDRSPDLDIISWNSLISGCASNGLFDRALNIFMQVLSMGIRPSDYTLSIVLSVCGTLLAVKEGKQLHAHLVKMQYLLNTAVGNTLLTAYSKFGMIEDAEILFGKLPNRNLISWTAIMTGFYKNKCFEKVLRQFNRMRHSGIEPNEHTFAVSLASCGGMTHPSYGMMLHAQAIKNGMSLGVFVGTAIVDMYSEFEEMLSAEKEIEEMGSVASDVSWNALVAGYVRNGKNEDAMDAFLRMLNSNIMCNQFTYSNILKACSSLPSLASGEQIHCQVVKTNCNASMHVGSSLIEMYAKCGSLAYAERIFNQIPMPDVVSWNSIIKAYSKNGDQKKSIFLFRKMIEEGLIPTSATFLAVLSACSHSGSVQEGQEYFKSMVQDYRITPEETHYSCIVDLLGRAGQLEDARDFINSLPIEPNASIWRPLLAACQRHKNLQMAELVAGRILEIDPGDPTVYVTLSNMYAEVGRWVDVEKQRNLMELKEVKKEPGCSWIEVNNRIHKFFSRDTRHTEMPKIHEKLEELVRQIKNMGYVPDTNLVLHQGEEASKEEHILCHSEKLAVCFGLLSLPAGRPIRIFKNLRVCQDCHSAMKYISRITERDIVLRDNYRFHCFKQGYCSCGDYW